MYQNPGQTQQWNPNQPPPTSQHPPQQWSPQPASGQYVPRPNQIPPISQALPQGPAMQTLQPQHPDQYRALPPPNQMYAPPYQHPQQMPYPPAQPAPRQRTAIACRYCRRRKIRCSGFEQADGRCTNCIRFSQECLFTPVSAQTQAFVPAHTIWRGQQPPPNTQLYGPYGQPLPPNDRDQYPPQQQPQQAGQYPPPPQGYQQQGMYPPQQQQQQVQPPPPEAGRKRTNEDPHTPTLPPPPPGQPGQGPLRGADGQAQYAYPDPTGLTPAGASPASSNASFHSAQQPQVQPYYAQPVQPQHRASPQSAYSYDASLASRASSSPHNIGQPGTPAPPTSNSNLAPSMPIREGRTPPPGSAAAAQRQGVKINELVGGGMKQEERTTTDSKKDDADGIFAGADGGERREGTRERNGVSDVKDVGIQVNFDRDAME